MRIWNVFVVLGAFIFINFYRVDQGFVSELPQTEDPRQVAEETSHLAPHGVPSNPIPRALSSTKLHELANQDGYGATYQMGQGGTLDIPGANPFKQNVDNQDQQRYTGFQVRSKYTPIFVWVNDLSTLNLKDAEALFYYVRRLCSWTF